MGRVQRPEPPEGYLWCSGVAREGVQPHLAPDDQFGRNAGMPHRRNKQPACKSCKRLIDSYWNPIQNPTTNKNPKYDGVRKKSRDARRARERGKNIVTEPVLVGELYDRDEGICWLCEKHIDNMEDATRDHVHPLSPEGHTTWDNLRIAHRSCNSRKRDKPLDQIGDLLAEMRHPLYTPGQTINGKFHTFRRAYEATERSALIQTGVEG